jgi:hypothetical protein
MFFLVPDACGYTIFLRQAYGERAEIILPTEFQNLATGVIDEFLPCC